MPLCPFSWEVRMLELSFGPVSVAALTEIAFLQRRWSYERSIRGPCTHWPAVASLPVLASLPLPNVWQISTQELLTLLISTNSDSLLREKYQNNP